MAARDPNDVIDYSQFEGRLNARTDRWSLLREVMDEWGIAVDQRYRGEITEEVIAHAERRLGLSLPVALKEWYALPERFHTTEPVYGTYVSDPAVDEDGGLLREWKGVVSFHHEMCSCCEWGFAVGDAGIIDPPIYNGMDMNSTLPGPTEPNYVWVPQNASLSEWALQMTISDALGYGNSLVATVPDWVGAPRAQVEQLLDCFSPLGFPLQPWYQWRLYGGMNVILSVGPADCRASWAKVDEAAPHPAVIPRETWESYWREADQGPCSLALYCRDAATLERLMSSVDLDWSLWEPSAR